MKWLIASFTFIIAVLMPFKALSKTLTVAVIDTGIDPLSVTKLCKFGHKSFVKGTDPLRDTDGHGTHIAGIIQQNAGDSDYCLVSLKFYSEKNTGAVNLKNTIDAINYAINIKVDFINYSGGGPEFSEQEYLALRRALKQGIKIVTAAGNEKTNLDLGCDYYPACYDRRIISVGNLDPYRRPIVPQWARNINIDSVKELISKMDNEPLVRSPSSNYGKIVSRWEIGTNVKSTLPGGKMGYMSGTSQATAVATGKLVKESSKHE